MEPSGSIPLQSFEQKNQLQAKEFTDLHLSSIIRSFRNSLLENAWLSSHY